jgi:hypothetical protein
MSNKKDEMSEEDYLKRHLGDMEAGIREHRFNWRKQKLIKLGYDVNKTEEEIMIL